MALDTLTKEQEQALIIIADREIARKVIEDAVTQAEADLAEVNGRFLAEQSQVNDAIITKYTAELRAKQEAVSRAKDSVSDNIKAVAIATTMKVEP